MIHMDIVIVISGLFLSVGKSVDWILAPPPKSGTNGVSGCFNRGLAARGAVEKTSANPTDFQNHYQSTSNRLPSWKVRIRLKSKLQLFKTSKSWNFTALVK